MRALPSQIPDLRLFQAPVHRDARGWLVESFRAVDLLQAGLPSSFPQENCSLSEAGVLRGLHFQERQAQGKLITVLSGEIFDVVVDLRSGSPTRGWWLGLSLRADEPSSFWVPPGFAHGFYVRSGPALVQYKLTRPYAPRWDRCLAWDDPTLAIDWPLSGLPLLSERDRQGLSFAQVPAWSAQDDPPELSGQDAR